MAGIGSFEVPGWTQEDVDRRNREVFGAPRPAEPEPQLDAVAADIPESVIEAECSKLLAEDGWRALRTDPVTDRGRGKGFGEIGMCDHLYMRPRAAAMGSTLRDQCCCDVLWCEFKTANRKAEKRQRAWHARERARGFTVWVANETFPASVDGFREHYAKSGLMWRSKWW